LTENVVKGIGALLFPCLPQAGAMLHALCGILFGGPTFLWMTSIHKYDISRPHIASHSNYEIREVSLFWGSRKTL